MAVKIYERYRGQQIVFPVHLLSKVYIMSKIRDEYQQGIGISELASKYGYTERWLQRKLKEN